ncbi:DUF2683 family protein [Candidatus Micrarchaeota archaeon]|nr:DUF2683 family protein [Candidatus Micrarchaeota archaeon]
MVQVQVDLDGAEDKIVRLIMAINNIKDKRIAIKRIVRKFGEKNNELKL